LTNQGVSVLNGRIDHISSIKLTHYKQSQILVVSKCMLSLFRPSFEVVKEGRILNFL